MTKRPAKRRPVGVARTLRVEEGSAPRREVLEALGVQRPAVLVIAGPELGTRRAVEGSWFVIGRDPEAGLALSDPRVSFHHCHLEDRGDGWAVVDVGSTNGVRVNGERVAERMLAPSDKIELGDTVLRFEIRDPKDQAFDEMVQRLIDIDDLTGLLQRRRFDRELERLVLAAQTAGEPLGMLVMDLDGLKAINDAHGHLFGAHAISEAGRLIGTLLPRDAIAGRFGGDEFVAAAPGRGIDETSELGARIVAGVRERRFDKDGVELRLGISIGAAAFPDHAEDALALFARADEAMYAAKRAGKGCVRVYGRS
ncbi:MAG: diguanylate cyclase [Sandaracinaceae bacterium]|nr:diguanylate cyclase [Sandaracinaceae bacterium]